MSGAGDYYERASHANSDGTPLFAGNKDKQYEDETAEIIEQAWRCQIHKFGQLAPIDYYAIRDGRMVGLLELKSRSHAHGKYPTVFLNVRKWLALVMGAAGMAVPAMFIVRFTNGLYYIPVAEVDATKIIIGGPRRSSRATVTSSPLLRYQYLISKRFRGVNRSWTGKEK